VTHPFLPAPGKTVNINVGASSANVLLYPEKGPVSVRIENDGTATVWIAFGNSSVTASATADVPVPPGAVEVLRGINNSDQSPLYVAAIAAGATGKIYFTPGMGI
jgi:hypothetical protein